MPYNKKTIKNGQTLDIASGGVFSIAGTTVTASADELNLSDGQTATAAEVNRVCDKSASVVSATDNLTVTEALHGDRLVVLNKAAGATMTLPAATGTGNRYTFIVGTTLTSNSYIVKVANATDVMEGIAIGADDDVEGAGTAHTWNCETNDDTITMDGAATGGKLGDKVEVIDYASGHFHVNCLLTQSGGSEATPFSATVS